VLKIITITTILIYILFSTIFRNYDLVGVIGKNIGIWNIKIFGYIAYIDFLFILIPVYKIYKEPKLKEKIELYIGWFLLFISILILQGLLLGVKHSGIISSMLYNSLHPYIGTAGLWFLFLLSTILSISLISEKEIHEILTLLNFDKLKKNIKDIQEIIINKIYTFFSAKDEIEFDNLFTPEKKKEYNREKTTPKQLKKLKKIYLKKSKHLLV